MTLAAAKDPGNSILYAYLGGGVTFQPPHTFALVFKGMPQPVAKKFLALIQVLCNIPSNDIIMIRRQNRNRANPLDEFEKEDELKQFARELEHERRKLQDQHEKLNKRWDDSFDDGAEVLDVNPNASPFPVLMPTFNSNFEDVWRYIIWETAWMETVAHSDSPA